MSNEDQDILALLFGYILGKNSDKDELVCMPEYLTRLGWVHKTELEENEQCDKVRITQLKQENVKLKNEIRELRDDLELERDYADQTKSKEMKAVAENVELRELCRDMWRDIPKSESCGWDIDANCCIGDDKCKGECSYWYRMRKLGIKEN